MKTQFLFISIPLAVNAEFLTRQEVASLLNIDLKTLYNYTKKGLIKAHRFEYRVLYKRRELVKFITNKL